MNPEIYQQILGSLRRGPLPLLRLYAEAREAGSRWSEDQIRLFLEIMDGIEVVEATEAMDAMETTDAANPDGPFVRLGERTEAEELGEAIVHVVCSQGGEPIPAAQVKALLPSRFTTSIESIKAISRKTPGLEVLGPGLIRYKK